MIKKVQRKIKICDICRSEENKDDHWSCNFNGATAKIYQDGMNGIPCVWENLCRPCREGLINAIHNEIERRRALFKLPKRKPKYQVVAYVNKYGWSHSP